MRSRAQKEKIVAFANQHGKQAACKKFGVYESQIYQWQKSLMSDHINTVGMTQEEKTVQPKPKKRAKSESFESVETTNAEPFVMVKIDSLNALVATPDGFMFTCRSISVQHQA